jgi:lipoprotein Spr
MVKKILLTTTVVCLLGKFQPLRAQKEKQGTTPSAKTDLKFLDDISIDVPLSYDVSTNVTADGKSNSLESPLIKKNVSSVNNSSINIESAHTLQFKYAQLLNLEVEQIQNLPLFKLIDEWLGTRYRLGGSTKDGIDCSAFMQVLFTTIYGISLPRTAKEQYNLSRKVSRTELKQGDLVFFNTLGGVSHVGMYLDNNKFVHASSSGVTISDIYEDYWSRRFIGVGRMDSLPSPTLMIQP